MGLQLSWLERTPDKREVDGSSPFKPTQDNILKCTLKTAYRNIVFLDECEPQAKHEFGKQVVLSNISEKELQTTSRHCFLDEHELKTNVTRENNKTMYLLKRFNTDTLVSVKLKRTNMSYLKYY